LNVNPYRIRFTNTFPLFDTSDQTLNQAYLDAPILYYEIFDLNITESNLEEGKFFKIIWLGNTVKDEVPCSMYNMCMIYWNFFP
jgi:hypothetical protein